MVKEELTQQDVMKTNEYWFQLSEKYRLEGGRRVDHIVLERGRGIYIWDVEGKKYMDFESGQMCMSIGHSHPRLRQVIIEEVEKTDCLMQHRIPATSIPRILLAQKLAQITPGSLQRSYFASTGSESVEAALRLAKKYTGCFEVVCLIRGFHGRTLGSASYSTVHVRGRAGYGPHLPGATFIPAPYCYRCPFKESPPCDLSCLDYAEDVIDRATSGEPAALLMEFVIGAGGMIIPPVEWVKRVREICNERGMLIIADESMTGIGRTGKWFACQQFPVVPDILTTSKALGGGIPLSAVITTEQIGTEAIRKGHVQVASHMGDPFQCTVGLTNIQIIEQENLLDNAAKVGAYMKKGFEDIAARCDVIGDVRGVGLFLGLEIVESRETKKMAGDLTVKLLAEMRKRGILAGGMGGSAGLPNVIRLCPPLVITEEEVATALTIFEEALTQVTSVSKS